MSDINNLLSAEDGSIVEPEDKHIRSLRTTNWRWVALVWACLILLGSYMCVDYPSYLNTEI